MFTILLIPALITTILLLMLHSTQAPLDAFEIFHNIFKTSEMKKNIFLETI